MAAVLQCNSVLAASNVLGEGGSPREATLDARVKGLVPLLDSAVRTFPKAWLGRGDTILLYCGFDHRRSRFRLFEIALRTSGVSYKEKARSKQRVVWSTAGVPKDLNRKGIALSWCILEARLVPKYESSR